MQKKRGLVGSGLSAAVKNQPSTPAAGPSCGRRAVTTARDREKNRGLPVRKPSPQNQSRILGIEAANK
jgi:hypothetical protein